MCKEVSITKAFFSSLSYHLLLCHCLAGSISSFLGSFQLCPVRAWGHWVQYISPCLCKERKAGRGKSCHIQESHTVINCDNYLSNRQKRGSLRNCKEGRRKRRKWGRKEPKFTKLPHNCHYKHHNIALSTEKTILQQTDLLSCPANSCVLCNSYF